MTDGANPVEADLQVRLVDNVPPGPPRHVRVTVGDAEATIYWEPPHDDGGAPVEYYEYRVGPGTRADCRADERECARLLDRGDDNEWTRVGGEFGGPDERQVIVRNLTNGKLNEVRLRAVNVAGKGMHFFDSVIPVAGAPAAPVLSLEPVVENGERVLNEVRLSWTAPAYDRRMHTLTRYVVQMSSTGEYWGDDIYPRPEGARAAVVRTEPGVRTVTHTAGRQQGWRERVHYRVQAVFTSRVFDEYLQAANVTGYQESGPFSNEVVFVPAPTVTVGGAAERCRPRRRRAGTHTWSSR